MPFRLIISTDGLLVSEFFGIIKHLDHKASEARTMKNGLLTTSTILALMCLVQAKDKLAPTKDAVQGNSIPNVGTIIVYRLWSFSGAGRSSCDMEVGWSDNSGDFLSA